ncbi:MAG: hypothetical protein VW270_10385 [Candidatus Poseidoniales archaeon]|jgi:hypothetical protein
MIGSFREYLVEEERQVFFTFGRMNPPTIGHEKLVNKLSSAAGKNPYRVYLSQSQDAKKNPLDYKTKIKTVRKMFPRHARSVMLDNKIKNVMDILSKLYDEGFKRVTMVVGSDRINEFEALTKKYNGQKARHGFYNFEKINIVSAGDRDPDAEGAEGMSASKMRAAASSNDFTQFSQGLPKNFSNAESKKLFNKIRKSMGLKESTNFVRHVDLGHKDDVREAYVNGALFEVGQEVIIKETDQIGTITVLGSNYVVVESNGVKFRKWLDAVEPIEEKSMYKDKPDWGTPESTAKAKKKVPGQNEGLWDNIRAKRARGERMRKPGEKGAPTADQIKRAQEGTEVAQDKDISKRGGTQPAKYHKGLSKTTKSKRDAHFKKYAEKPGDGPDKQSNYKPAPGDKDAKTKPSKHTLKFKQMYGDDVDEAVKVGKVVKTAVKRVFKTKGGNIRGTEAAKAEKEEEKTRRMQKAYHKASAQLRVQAAKDKQRKIQQKLADLKRGGVK